MGLSSRRWTHVVWMGVYRRDVIVKNNIKFIAGLHHQDIVWTTEFSLTRCVRDIPSNHYINIICIIRQ